MAFIKETGFSPGARYTVQVRARSKTDRQRVSDWSNAFTFTTSADTIPPMPPSNLTMTAEGSSFVAKWDAPTKNADGTNCTDLAGYRLYFVNTENENQFSREMFTADEGFTLSFEDNKEIFGLPEGKLTLHVMSVDQMGNRSTKATVSAENPPPADVTGLTVEPGIESVVINWDENTVDLDLQGYKVYASTEGSGFTPGAGNLKYSGTGTNFILSTSNPVPHHVKVVAYDVFRLESVNPAYGVATPRTTTGADNIPPAEPTNADAETLIDGHRTSLRVFWEDPDDSDLSHILVRYSTDNIDWSFAQAPAGEESIVIDGILPGTEYYVSVRAYDLSGNKSNWVHLDDYPYETDKNLTAPNKPSSPSVLNDSSASANIWITHDLKDEFGDKLENVSAIKVFKAAGGSANPETDTLIETIMVAPGDLFASATTTEIASGNNEKVKWYVVAVNIYGVSSAASNLVQSDLEQLTGSHIKDATITSAKISSLQANKLEANSAFVNDLYIRSKLTIDDVYGEISSSDYSAATEKGWKIDKSGIVINEGIIKAKALEIQTGPNLFLPEYSSFEFNDAFYFNASGVPLLTAFISDAGVSMESSADSKYGYKSLKITAPAGVKRITLNPFGAYRLKLDPLQTYIVSGYIKNLGGNSIQYELIAEGDAGTKASNAKVLPSSSGWERISFPITLKSNESGVMVSVQKNTSYATSFLIDGMQVERKIGSDDNPSNYSPPGMTSIAGEGIVTGSIRSSAAAVGIPTQPAWSLNTQGNMQVGDALVRGNLVVGAGADTTNSVVKSSDYQAGVSGWVIRGDGYAEFNDGLFRSDLLLERKVNDVTLRLKASVADSVVFTPGGTSGYTTVAKPLITGESYAFDRTSTTGGWYIPTAANPNKKMQYAFGPTTSNTLMIQMTDGSQEGMYASLPPDNTVVNNILIGEHIDYEKDPVVMEQMGGEFLTYRMENTDAPFVTRSGVTQNTKNLFKNENYSRITNRTNFRSPFYPESNDRQTHLSDFFSKSENILEAKSQFKSPAKNLIAPPYDYTQHEHSWTPWSSSKNIFSSGYGGLAIAMGSSANIMAQGVAESMLFDTNYKIPVYSVGYARGTATQKSGIWFNSTGTVNASTGSVTGLRPGKTYIVSMFVRTDHPKSATNTFRVSIGMRHWTGTTAQDLVTGTDVYPGRRSQRIYAAITIPTSSTGANRGTPYIILPSRSETTGSDPGVRDITISRIQVELKTWGDHPNPEIANSNAPTAWSPSERASDSENHSAIKLVTNSNSDWLYDAYGIYDPDNKIAYASESVKTYREAPSYLDIILKRKTAVPSSASLPETAETVYRFSEAGVMYPGAYEPMRPAGLEVVYANRTVIPNTFSTLTDYNLKLSSTSHGIGDEFTGDIRLSSNFYIEVMRTGFYALHTGIHVPGNVDANIWMTFESNDIEFHSQGIGRIYTHAFNINTVKFLNKGDRISAKVYNGPLNAHSFSAEGVRVTIVRIA